MKLPNTIYYLLLPLLFLVLSLKPLLSKKRHRNNLPPSPPSFPIFGHLHHLKSQLPLHRTLQNLAQKYGPVMYLKFGSRGVVVVSKASIAEECFTKNDIVFANRLRTLMGKHITYDHSTMIQSSYGDYWRNLRRIGSIEIFSTYRINLLQDIRKDEIKRLLVKLSRNSLQEFSKVELKSIFEELTLNIMMRMVVGKRYYGDDVSDKEEAREFQALIKEVMSYAGVSNVADFLPILKWIDGGDYEKRVIKLGKDLDLFLQRLVDEIRRKRKKSDQTASNTIVDHLIALQDSEPEYYTDKMIKGFILTILFAGSDTTGVALEWAVTNLVNNPSTLEKAKEELDNKVGVKTLIDESDLPKLQYLHNVIFETLRLFPSVPLLVPHRSSKQCNVGGYTIPSDTILLVNAWTIHRDCEIWEDGTRFKPERFGCDCDGTGDKLSKLMLPFGLGRRSCPGSTLAQRVLGLTLGSLIQCFEWKRVSEEEEDTTEGRGITLPKVKPLEVMCKARPIIDKILSSH